MTEHPNAKLIRHGYDASAHGDLEALREFMAPDVVWHEPGRGPLAGDHKAPRASLRCSESCERAAAERLRSRSSTCSQTRSGPSRSKKKPRRGDRALDMASAVELEIHQGKITEVTVYHADTYHFDQFWAS